MYNYRQTCISGKAKAIVIIDGHHSKGGGGRARMPETTWGGRPARGKGQAPMLYMRRNHGRNKAMRWCRGELVFFLIR